MANADEASAESEDPERARAFVAAVVVSSERRGSRVPPTGPLTPFAKPVKIIPGRYII